MELYEFIPVSAKTKLLTLQEVFQGAARNGRGTIPVVGDCMEAAGIMDGGSVAVDFTHYPRPGRMEGGKWMQGDPCICYASAPASDLDAPDNPPTVLCKQYDGLLMFGHSVGTRYRLPHGSHRMNCTFPAIAILGVVYASWGPDGELLCETDPNTYPTELPHQSTSMGGNVGEAMVLKSKFAPM